MSKITDIDIKFAISLTFKLPWGVSEKNSVSLDPWIIKTQEQDITDRSLSCFETQRIIKSDQITVYVDWWNIQGDSGGKVSIFGGYSVGHCEKNTSHEHVSISEQLWRWSCVNLQA